METEEESTEVIPGRNGGAGPRVVFPLTDGGVGFGVGEDGEFSFRQETLEVQVDSVMDIGSQAPSAP